ncbi:P-loop NTPase family protein [Thiorhodovibrio frisius]|uniref:Uncharacterized protein n=1 Tax=Thiorhodovibrio frisius TaxID=631362 RepID=H8Z527_9GAMM|nr:ATP-binding protein [Thiorhodovibrio frisius]EIC20434.1 hypothetical protein Thi970DRAFT_04070 [Thiorhodovibrio frisius]WPL21177.1 hypothetical protein Thiofri_01288 [Thiorhodovibrio frisius]
MPIKIKDGAFPTDQVRRSLDELPDTMDASTNPPDPNDLYVVLGHERALDPNSTLVVGDRGSGKSFWSAALNSPVSRALIHAQLPRLQLDRVETSWGFSVSTRNADHPSRRVLQRLHGSHAAEDIWRAVVLRQLTSRYDEELPGKDWAEVVAYVADNPEREERLLSRIAGRLAADGKRHLVIFDALDRTGSDWKAIRALVRGLLQVCLDLKGQTGIQAKVFLRPDMWEDRSVWQFPDSSKLHHGRVILEWRRTDLYGLLWHWLCNHGDGAKMYRHWLQSKHHLSFTATEADGAQVYPIPAKLRQDEDLQQAVLHDMATRYMGANRRRGRTYTWLPNHLADAKGQVSPRSFLIAVRDAQRETQARGHGEVLHWEGIKRGVQSASLVRVQELREDYPWIQTVLMPLNGQTVPCRDEDIMQRWENAQTVQAIERDRTATLSPEPFGSAEIDDERFYLPPHALADRSSDTPEKALIQELQRIGVIRRVDDDRVDIPDLFRVAAAIGRRGGVRPIR